MGVPLWHRTLCGWASSLPPSSGTVDENLTRSIDPKRILQIRYEYRKREGEAGQERRGSNWAEGMTKPSGQEGQRPLQRRSYRKKCHKQSHHKSTRLSSREFRESLIQGRRFGYGCECIRCREVVKQFFCFARLFILLKRSLKGVKSAGCRSPAHDRIRVQHRGSATPCSRRSGLACLAYSGDPPSGFLRRSVSMRTSPLISGLRPGGCSVSSTSTG